MKRFAAVLTFALFALAAPAAAVLPPVGNDHTKITATFGCAADGTQTITWLIENFTHSTTMTVSSWTSTPDATTPLSTTVGPQSFTTATATITPGTTHETATLVADWPTTREDHVTDDVPVPTGCAPPTTTTVTPTTVTPTSTPIGGQGSTVAPPTTVTVASTPGGTLPFTGSASGVLFAIGVALAGIGGVLASISRAKRAHSLR
jgi:hypothetical protein